MIELPNLLTLHPDRIAQVREDIRFEMESALRQLDEIANNQEQHTCRVCEDWGYGYKSIPSDWAYIADGNNYLLCGNCLGRWLQRWELPELSRELEI